MIPKSSFSDFKTIGHYTGRMVAGFGLLMLIPLCIALCVSEYAQAINFGIGFSTSVLVAYLILIISGRPKELSWMNGMVVVSLSWLIVMFLGAIPFYLSGHFGSYLDSCFDAMSGLATIGLYLLQNLDHISTSLNMWRFLLPYVGGQGMVLIALVFLTRTAGVYGLYTGEGREDKILPNVIQTARMIWTISLIYFIIGVSVLWLLGIRSGFSPKYAFWHGMWLYMSAWSTSGFAPTTTSLLFYHNQQIELATLCFFILGSLNFSLHYAVWSRKRAEIVKNLEIRSFLITLGITFSIICSALVKEGIYPDFLSLFKKAVYIAFSAHTTTGLSTVYSAQLVNDWGELAMVAIICAMAIGGCSGSTAGGIKCLRVGILTKALVCDIKQLALPSTAVIQDKFHHIKDVVMNDRIVRSAMLIFLSFLFTYLLGAVVGVFYGYPFLHSLFDSIAAGSTSGLSTGVVSPNMPDLLKVVYIFEMWAGRLEFVSIFALCNLTITSRIR
jgi:trk system potassium uptake protein TrkH